MGSPSSAPAGGCGEGWVGRGPPEGVFSIGIHEISIFSRLGSHASTTSNSGGHRQTQAHGPAIQAALFMTDNTSATVSPNEDGVGTIVTPALFKSSTFSCADSPKAEMIAPAWPMRRPFGAERPAM